MVTEKPTTHFVSNSMLFRIKTIHQISLPLHPANILTPSHWRSDELFGYPLYVESREGSADPIGIAELVE